MSPQRTRSLLLVAVLVLLGAGVLAIGWHFTSNRDEIPAGEVKDVKVNEPIQQQTNGFPPPRAPVAPESDELIFSSVSSGTVTVRWEHAPGAKTTTPYRQVPPPSDHDAATNADFTLVDGQVPPGYANPLPLLHDGLMPPNADERTANFRLAIGSGEGRVKIDLHKPIRIREINSYSWHTDIRGPQVHTVYGSNGSEADFNPTPKNDIDPATCGWKKIADVDTRPASGFVGGRYAVSISDSSGSLGTYRYLLFCMQPASKLDGMGHTFYSEIDVVE